MRTIKKSNLNYKSRFFIKNFTYSITSNLLSLIISSIVTLILPRFIGVESYGYWQLYLFYTTFVGFMHFGWNDGIYLRYGGIEYQNLDKKLIYSQFWMLSVLQFIILVVIIVLSKVFIKDYNKEFVVIMTSFVMLIVNLRYMILYILQATNRIKEYSIVTIVDRVSFMLLIIYVIFFFSKNFKMMIIADILGKFISLLISLYFCKDIIFQRFSNFYFSFREAYINITIGIKLMIANIASSLIIGIVRFGIEKNWDISTFGKISLTLSISNMFMLFINAIGLVMYPMLRRTKDRNTLIDIYINFRTLLIVFLLLVLLFYYPLKIVLIYWLPNYEDSFKYMAILFPIFIYEGKMSLLISTYLKTIRKEKILLQVNIFTMILSLIFTYFTIIYFNNLNLTILSILILLVLRSTLGELYLLKELNLPICKDIIIELHMIGIFVYSSWYINSWLTVIIYGITYIIYILFKRKNLIKTYFSLTKKLKI